ncbi:MAG: Asp-tRNA(Asn)/Glu-tRNA(Gln) amidotransferase subunit GatC [Planctomycetia bacterium]
MEISFNIEKLAKLSRLQLSDDEAAAMTGQLASILGYVEQLAVVDTAGVEPMAHPLPLRNVFRADDARAAESLPPDAALANAAKRFGDFYAVPAILD